MILGYLETDRQQAHFATCANAPKQALVEVMFKFPQSIDNNIKALRSSFKIPNTVTRLY